MLSSELCERSPPLHHGESGTGNTWWPSNPSQGRTCSWTCVTLTLTQIHVTHIYKRKNGPSVGVCMCVSACVCGCLWVSVCVCVYNRVLSSVPPCFWGRSIVNKGPSLGQAGCCLGSSGTLLCSPLQHRGLEHKPPHLPSAWITGIWTMFSCLHSTRFTNGDMCPSLETLSYRATCPVFLNLAYVLRL